MTSSPHHVPALDRTVPPVPAAVKPFRFPEFLHHRLDNGLQVYLARVDRAPLVGIEVMSRAGVLFDPPDRLGLASLHGELLDQGTAQRGSSELSSFVESLGGSLSSAAGWNAAYAEAALLSRHLDAGLDLLTEIIRQPSFPEEEIERLRQRRLTDLLRRRDRPVALVDRQLAKALYGDGVYGRPALGRPASIEGLDRDALLRFNERHMLPSNSVFLAVGDIQPDDMLRRVEAAFGDWSFQEPVALPDFETRPLDGVEVYVIDRPEAAQTQLQLGHVGVARSHGDFPTLMLVNSVFGGKFTSRINLNLRETHGFTYGAQSTFERRLGPGAFFIRTAVANDVSGRAVDELLKEMHRMLDEPVEIEELDDSRSYMNGYFAYSMQTVGDLLKRLESLAVFGLPDDYYERFPEMLAAVGIKELQDAAQRHLHPDRLAIIAAGPAAELVPQLRHLAEPKVVTPDEVMG